MPWVDYQPTYTRAEVAPTRIKLRRVATGIPSIWAERLQPRCNVRFDPDGRRLLFVPAERGVLKICGAKTRKGFIVSTHGLVKAFDLIRNGVPFSCPAHWDEELGGLLVELPRETQEEAQP